MLFKMCPFIALAPVNIKKLVDVQLCASPQEHPFRQQEHIVQDVDDVVMRSVFIHRSGSVENLSEYDRLVVKAQRWPIFRFAFFRFAFFRFAFFTALPSPSGSCLVSLCFVLTHLSLFSSINPALNMSQNKLQIIVRFIKIHPRKKKRLSGFSPMFV